MTGNEEEQQIFLWMLAMKRFFRVMNWLLWSRGVARNIRRNWASEIDFGHMASFLMMEAVCTGLLGQSTLSLLTHTPVNSIISSNTTGNTA